MSSSAGSRSASSDRRRGRKCGVRSARRGPRPGRHRRWNCGVGSCRRRSSRRGRSWSSCSTRRLATWARSTKPAADEGRQYRRRPAGRAESAARRPARLNGRGRWAGKAEQYIKEGKNAIKWTRLSCRKFRDNEVRLQLHAMAYDPANFMRTLALPKEVEHWSLTTLREKLVKIGAKVVRHGRYVTFQLAEVAVPRELFRKILSPIDDLRRRPAPA